MSVKARIISLIVLLLILLTGRVTHAQEQTPRPTPTNEPDATPTSEPTATSQPTATNEPTDGNNNGSDDQQRGTIQGRVYQDTNGDGRCVNTGIPGEEPIEGIDVEFVSSDEETVIVNYTGPEGIYGLVAAGQSYWAVTVKPGSEWIVTSEPTLYAPIYPDSLTQTDINFCLQKTANSQARIILPDSGAPNTANTALFIVALLGMLLVLAGVGLRWRER